MFENRKETFPEREKRIQKFWKTEKIFKKSLENRKKILNLRNMMVHRLQQDFLTMGIS